MQKKKNKKSKNSYNPNPIEFVQRTITPSMCFQECTASTACSECTNFDLCKKRVCIVGGVERMESTYREFIEKRCNGKLDYHSGSMQGGIQKLENFIQRADIIICPITCNSHGACVHVKNCAKRLGKDFHMLPTASISALRKLFSTTI